MPGAKNWCFTLNNYVDEDLTRLNEIIETCDFASYLLYGKEVGANGTHHLQGFISLSARKEFNAVKRLLGDTVHLEVCRNVVASRQYCKKDGDFYEFGEFVVGCAGKRNDLDEFKDAVKGGMLDISVLRENYSETMAKYPRFCLDYVGDKMPKVTVEDFPLRQWQQRLYDKLQTVPDRRKIIFIVDKVGNSGKSWFAHWYANKFPETTQVLVPGRKQDMSYALRLGLKVVFMDAPRSKNGDFIQYDFLEELKNGFVFSSKYESRTKQYEPLHVVVCMNEAPDKTKLSRDRYDVTNIIQLDFQVPEGSNENLNIDEVNLVYPLGMTANILN